MPQKPKQASLIAVNYPVSNLSQLLGHLHLSATNMKMGKTPMLLKKATSMCKSKTSLLADRFLVLATLQRRRMAAVAMISNKIHTLIVADRERGSCHKAVAMRKVESRQAIVHGGDMAANFSHQLAMFDQEDGHGGFPDWTFMHPLFNDDMDENCCYTDDVDLLLDACDAGNDEPSVMEAIRSSKEVEGLEFNVEQDIDRAADIFIKRFRQQMNHDF
ncbi:hypothetical protein QYE76_006569 [Lolium multiflorum]|jgi:hypothetical protein|uniref:Uncharacterized protein n=2 Tax=Lolium TaxID=4520 RepID=A0AAD8W3F8_LOLMU|nr:uncharacterized protein LOC127302375 [Lolium perenne]KAK1632254.1 hypothetical protein QYE76_006569 [Lolium multiflorum]